MKNAFILLVAGIAILFIYGCEKEEKPYVPVVRCTSLTRDIDTINTFIHGTWEFLEELRCSWDGCQYLTPKSPGMNRITLKLSNDTARFFKNSMPDSVYKFRIQREFEISNYPPDSLPVIVYYSFYTGLRRTYVPIMICENQLLMQHQFVSSIVGESIWVRK